MIARHRRSFGLLAGAVAIIGGCNDPSSPASSPGGAKLTVELYVPARFATDPELTVYVSGWLTPGRDDAGALRDVESPLLVAGKSIAFPFPPRSDWANVQSIIVPLPVVRGQATFAVSAPAIAGVQPTIPLATVGTIRLTDVDTVRARVDGSVRIHPELPEGTDAPTTRSWTLVVTGTSTVSFTVPAALPTEIVVPRELLPPPAPGGWQLDLTVSDTFGPPTLPVPGGAYDVNVKLVQRFIRTALPAGMDR